MRVAFLLFRRVEECAADFEILCADRVVIVRVRRTGYSIAVYLISKNRATGRS